VLQDWREAADAAAAESAAAMVEVRRRLHAHPEPSGEEFGSSHFIQQCLVEAGLEARLTPSGRGVLVDPSAGPPRHGIALRADIDALRIQDEKTAPYRSQRPGVMHACGHDGHTATVFGALLALHRLERDGALPWPVAWRGIFQPAEETGEGALEMVAAGALEGVDAVLAAHLDPSRPVGRVGVRYGALTAACDALQITIRGRGGHAARPHESLDPIAAAAQLISAIYLFVPRGGDSHDPVVVTIGQIQAGDNPNVIPDQALLKGTIRTLGGPVRERVQAHLQQIARGVAEASGAQIDLCITPGAQSVVNDPGLTDLLKSAATDVLGGGQVDIIARPSMGGEDFSYYLDHVPGAMFRLGCASPEVGNAPLHSPLFDLDERALVIGARILARAVVLGSRPQDGRPEETP